MTIKIGKRELRQWVKALRSGDYKQTSGTLCRNEEGDPFAEDEEEEDTSPPENQLHCCLGVACDLFLDAYWHEDEDGIWKIQNAAGLPPTSLRKAIDEALPGLRNTQAWDSADQGACGALAVRNDDGRTFKQLARAIEQAAGL